MWGDVGRGKTVIVKSFIKNLDLKVIDFHYIDFMQSIHNELSSLSGKKNPLDHIAKSLSKKSEGWCAISVRRRPFRARVARILWQAA